MPKVRGTLSLQVDPPSIAAGAVANVDIVLPAGTPDVVHAGTAVIAQPPDTIEAGLVLLACTVPADGTIRVRLYNPSAGAIDGAARQWGFLLIEED